MKTIYGYSTFDTREKAACQQARVWLQYAAMLFLMMVVGMNDVKGQDTDYSGTYYIASMAGKAEAVAVTTYDPADPVNNFYLCPTEGWYFYKATNSTQTR